MSRRGFLKLSTTAMAGYVLVACSSATTTTQPAATSAATATEATATEAPIAEATATEASALQSPLATTATDTTTSNSLTFNDKAWQYDATNDVYWQIGIAYCTKPETLDYETLGIFVPGAYLTATDNGDGTFTATINETGAINSFTAKTAPIVYPVNTPGYAAQKSLTAYSYDSVSSYMKAGYLYVHAGMRGRENVYDANNNLIFSGGAPWGVTDLKAAVRYMRYNAGVLPGNMDRMIVFGMSGGGAQSSIMGASGDSALYTPYLESIGAAMTDAAGQPISDAVQGVMAWCPITSLDYADEAYEWNMGQYASTDTRASTAFTSALSKDMATAFGEYINQLGLKDAEGNALTLEKTTDGIYAAGSYYNTIKSKIEESLNHFLADTTFPYTKTSGGFGGGMPGGAPPDGVMPQGETMTGTMPAGDAAITDTASASATITSTAATTGTVAVATATSTTYQTAQEYIDSLNKDVQWVTYDASANTATITSIAAFATVSKPPTKSVPAFDDLNRAQAENKVFGNDANNALHFNAGVADLLAKNQAAYAKFADWKAEYVDNYANDLKEVDKLGNGISYRMNAYNPMYYLLPYYEGYQKSTVAKAWRINTGIAQGDTANTVEMNLALALENYAGVDSVAFTTVWDQGHTMAERSGDSTDNFIAWVNEVASK